MLENAVVTETLAVCMRNFKAANKFIKISVAIHAGFQNLHGEATMSYFLAFF